MEATIVAAMEHWGLAAAFLVGLGLTVWAEWRLPLFARPTPDRGRIRTNLALGGLNLASQLIGALMLAQLVTVSERLGIGLLPRLGLHGLPLVLVSLLVIDFTQYASHWLSHRVAWLWRVHRVHHSDPGLDLSTTFRNHPLEHLLNLAWAAAFAIGLGLSPAAMLLYGAMVAIIAPLQHADVVLPARLERWLGAVVASPGLHQSHHSARQRETDSNYGIIGSCWDRLFGTFRPLSAVERRAMPIGLGARLDAGGHSLRHQLRSPFMADLPP